MAKTSHQVYGLRFLIGFFEGTTWPAYYTIISQWYLPHEVGLHMSLYNIAQPAGAMLSGATQDSSWRRKKSRLAVGLYYQCMGIIMHLL